MERLRQKTAAPLTAQPLGIQREMSNGKKANSGNRGTMSKRTRKTLSILIYAIEASLLFSAFYVGFFSDTPNKGSYLGYIISFIIVFMGADTFVKQEVNLRGTIIPKNENPRLYYRFLSLYLGLGTAGIIFVAMCN